MDGKPKVLVSDDCSWDGLNIEIRLIKSVSKQEKAGIEKAITEWADKGIEEGYGGGFIHHYDKLEWGKENNWAVVWMDLGSSDESAFDELSKKLSPSPFVKTIKVGYEHPDPLGFLGNEAKKEVNKKLKEQGLS